MALSAFTLSCSHHHYPSPEFFNHSKLKLYPLNSNSPFLPPLSPWQPPFYFLSLWIWLFSVCLSGLTQYLSFCVWQISLNVFRVHPCCKHVSEFHSFLRLKILHFIYDTTFCLSIHPNVDGHLRCYHLLAIGNNAVMNLDVQIISPSLYLQVFWVYTCKWNCWIIW